MPYEPSPPPRPVSWPWLIFSALIILAALLGLAGNGIPSACAGFTDRRVPSSLPASPMSFAFARAVTVVLVTHTPVATPEPTPTYTMLAPPKPPDICYTATPKGTVCSQPNAPIPTQTPIPPCPVKPEFPCVHPGGSGAAVEPDTNTGTKPDVWESWKLRRGNPWR